MPPPPFLDPATIDFTRLLAGKEAIRRVNPHRGHMEHLTAVVSMDTTSHIIVGYKDVLADEFWTAGHFPGYALLPGVIQCEAAAQLLSYYVTVNKIMSGNLLGLGGLEAVRFRHPVRPGDRLVIVGKGVKLHRRQTIFDAQGFVGNVLAFQCQVIGLPIPDRD